MTWRGILAVAEPGRFASFGAVGVAGFIVDALTLNLALHAGLGLYGGRAVSYLCAVTVTWELNRRFTFADVPVRATLAGWARFGASQLGGATANLGVYFLLVHGSPAIARHPTLGVALGSLAGLCVNFWTARTFAFRAERPARRARPD